MTIKEIKEELKEVKYYFSRKKVMDESIGSIGVGKDIMKLVQKYNKLAEKLPAHLYDVYYSLYVKNYKQETLALELSVSPNHICKRNLETLKEFKKMLDKGVNNE